MQTLSGRTCVFSGATGGDGIETVKALCAGGMNVVMMTHNIPAAEKLMAEVAASGAPGKCVYFAGGKREDGPAEENPALYQQIEEQFGSVDVIISNTGGPGREVDMEDVTGEELSRELNHLCVGAFKTVLAALPFLRRSAAPRIILMSSVEGEIGGTEESFPVAVAKGAVLSLTKNIAARVAKDGITVNCIGKGCITRLGARPDDKDLNTLLPLIPMGRLGTAQDLANIICFLASEESGYMTGQCLTLSGGFRQ